MAIFKGDAMAAVERARAAASPQEKVRALEDAVSELVRELEAVLTALGPENFVEQIRKILEEG